MVRTRGNMAEHMVLHFFSQCVGLEMNIEEIYVAGCRLRVSEVGSA